MAPAQTTFTPRLHLSKRNVSSVHVGLKNKVKPENLIDPDVCPHKNVGARGSTKDTVRTWCIDCGTFVHEEPRMQQGKQNPQLHACVYG